MLYFSSIVIFVNIHYFNLCVLMKI